MMAPRLRRLGGLHTPARMSDIWAPHFRCSNSRGALALLRERGLEPVVIDYIKEPLNVAQLTALVARLGVPVRELLRAKGGLPGARPGQPAAQRFGCGASVLIQRLLNRPIVW